MYSAKVSNYHDIRNFLVPFSWALYFFFFSMHSKSLFVELVLVYKLYNLSESRLRMWPLQINSSSWHFSWFRWWCQIRIKNVGDSHCFLNELQFVLLLSEVRSIKLIQPYEVLIHEVDSSHSCLILHGYHLRMLQKI